MDGIGLLIFFAGLLLWYFNHRRAFWMFLCGVGFGLFVGANIAALMIYQVLAR